MKKIPKLNKFFTEKNNTMKKIPILNEFFILVLTEIIEHYVNACECKCHIHNLDSLCFSTSVRCQVNNSHAICVNCICYCSNCVYLCCQKCVVKCSRCLAYGCPKCLFKCFYCEKYYCNDCKIYDKHLPPLSEKICTSCINCRITNCKQANITCRKCLILVCKSYIGTCIYCQMQQCIHCKDKCAQEHRKSRFSAIDFKKRKFY